MNPLETFSKICCEAVQECGPGAGIAILETAIRKRVDALPANDRDAVESAMKALTSYEPPGFHEHGAH